MTHPISAMALPNMTAENEKTDLLTSKDGPQLANDGSGKRKDQTALLSLHLSYMGKQGFIKPTAITNV